MNGYININQKGLVDFCTKNNCKIDLVDATLLSYIANFVLSDKIVKKLINNRVYGWISTKKIIQDNPLMNISNTEVIGRRIKKLVDIGLLYTYLCKEEGNKKYYAISDSLHKIITNSYDTTDSSVDTPTYSSVDTLPTFESGNSKINSNLNNSNKKINKKKLTKLKELLLEVFRDKKLLSFKSKINISVVDKDITKGLYTLEDINIDDIVKAYTEYIREHKNYAKRLNIFLIGLLVDKDENFIKYMPKNKSIDINNRVTIDKIPTEIIKKLKSRSFTVREIEDYITIYNLKKRKEYLNIDIEEYYLELEAKHKGVENEK